jgi:hypothetical protein
MPIFLLLLLFCISTCGYAQREATGVPPYFGTFNRSITLFNPADYNPENRIDTGIGNQRNTGSWANIQAFYAFANFRLGKRDEINSFQSVGAQLLAEIEGDFIRRSRFYADYAFHLRISPTYTLSAGTSLGVMSYTVLSTALTAGAGSNALDGSLGLVLRSNSLSIATSVTQLYNSKVQPYVEVYRLAPTFHFNIEKKIQFEQNKEILIFGYGRYTNSLFYDLYVGTEAKIKHLAGLGITYRYRRSVIASISFDKLQIGENDFALTFAYHIPTYQMNVINTNTFEIVINYFLKNKKLIQPTKTEQEIEKN